MLSKRAKDCEDNYLTERYVMEVGGKQELFIEDSEDEMFKRFEDYLEEKECDLDQ
jgi:hypothetical protein|tara:strand:+ start:2595 stop:2759 length:165 start_codon:yes stop_codon:yes gene_type:complete